MFPRILFCIACLYGCLAVGIGAIGAHGLPKWLEEQGRSPEASAKAIEQCEIAVRYQLPHAILVAACMLSTVGRSSRLICSASCFLLLGVTLFAGGLYSLVFLDTLGHWAIIPSGGMSMILGWFQLLVAGLVVKFERVQMKFC